MSEVDRWQEKLKLLSSFVKSYKSNSDIDESLLSCSDLQEIQQCCGYLERVVIPQLLEEHPIPILFNTSVFPKGPIILPVADKVPIIFLGGFGLLDKSYLNYYDHRALPSLNSIECTNEIEAVFYDECYFFRFPGYFKAHWYRPGSFIRFFKLSSDEIDFDEHLRYDCIHPLFLNAEHYLGYINNVLIYYDDHYLAVGYLPRYILNYFEPLEKDFIAFCIGDDNWIAITSKGVYYLYKFDGQFIILPVSLISMLNDSELLFDGLYISVDQYQENCELEKKADVILKLIDKGISSFRLESASYIDFVK